MTTIAWDGETLCTDTQVSSSGMVFGQIEKVRRLNNGSLLAVCGELWLLDELAAHIEAGAAAPELSNDDDFGAILIMPDGDAYEYCKTSSNKVSRHKACVPWVGGTGEAYALTALHLGHTATEAVKIACELDVSSGLPVNEYGLDGR